jgi:ribosomal subunit interface protein
MRINYTGKLSGLADDQRKKLDGRFAKLAKLLDTREEQRQAHVIVKTERHLTKAEITVHYYGHEIVGAAADGDPYLAMTAAAHNLETQVLKLRKKWIDSKRHNGKLGETPLKETPAKEAAAPAAKAKKPRVYRPRVAQSAKPLTAEEALLAIGKRDAYFLFRDPANDAASLLIRRDDGNFDLVEL